MNLKPIQPKQSAVLIRMAIAAIAVMAVPTTILTAHEPKRSKETVRVGIGAHAAAIARRELVYDMVINTMCAVGFRNEEHFDWFGGPATITTQCESQVNPVCSSGYVPQGVLATENATMSYLCAKVAGGPTPENPTCEARFTATDAGGAEYTCTAQVQRTCFQSHWQPTGLSAEGYRVIYQCWGRSL